MQLCDFYDNINGLSVFNNLSVLTLDWSAYERDAAPNSIIFICNRVIFKLAMFWPHY